MMVSFLWVITRVSTASGKEDTTMKKYFAPEMNVLAFVAEEAVAANSEIPGSATNDGSFNTWPSQN